MSTLTLTTARRTPVRDTGIVLARELKPVLRDPFSVVFSMVQPLFFLALFAPLLSSGAKSARKNSGWIIENTTENGSRSTGFSSRASTMPVSRTGVRRAVVRLSVLMRRPPASRTGPARAARGHRPPRHPRAGCGRSG